MLEFVVGNLLRVYGACFDKIVVKRDCLLLVETPKLEVLAKTSAKVLPFRHLFVIFIKHHIVNIAVFRSLRFLHKIVDSVFLHGIVEFWNDSINQLVVNGFLDTEYLMEIVHVAQLLCKQ